MFRSLTDQMLEALHVNASVMYMGNTVGDYTFALVLFVVALIGFKILQFIVVAQLKRFAEKTTTDLDDTFVKMVMSFSPPFYTFLALWVALRPLAITGIAEKLLTIVLIGWAVYQVVIAVGILVEDVIFQRFAKDTDPTTKSALRLLSNLAKGVLWGLGIILMLSNVGVDVTALVAGVGIGGIAIAFALQGILGDLFSSFSIYFDKPFKVGDFIIVGDSMGTVEHIGVKSTRMRSLTGEKLIISNQELTSARIQNYKDMQERRL